MKKLVAVAAVIACLGMSSESPASLVIDSVVGGQPLATGNYVNFDNLNLGNAGGMSGGVEVNLTDNGQIVTGAVGGQYAAPFLSNSNGVLFGDANPSGADTTQYVSTGSTGSVAEAQAELVFSGPVQYLGLLWGSVDDYNTLTFTFEDMTTQSITGLDVTAAANGDQGENGTFYVNITSTQAFTSVVATSSRFAFEFDNVAYGPVVPEPISGLLWAGFFGATAFIRRRRTCV